MWNVYTYLEMLSIKIEWQLKWWTMNDEQRVQLPIVGDNGDAYAFELLDNIAHGRNASMFYQKEERKGGKTSD